MQTRDTGEELNIKFTTDSERLLGIPFGFGWMEMNIGSDWLKNEFKDSTSEKKETYYLLESLTFWTNWAYHNYYYTQLKSWKWIINTWLKLKT